MYDDGQRVIAIADPEQLLRWAKIRKTFQNVCWKLYPACIALNVHVSPCGKVSYQHMGTTKPRSACAVAHADLGLRCPHTEYTPKTCFSPGAAHMIFRLYCVANKTDKYIYTQHYENMPIQIYKKFHFQTENFLIKNNDIFYISTQNIGCGYSLEPPWRGGSNEYPQFMFWAEIKEKCIPL